MVSILIPACNAEPFIAATIRSALAQTWPRKEIIIVDDGSRDRTAEIARQFASAELKVVSQPNAGASAARNHAYSLCQGDYIQWFDADDLLGPDKILRQMEAAERLADPRKLISGAMGCFYWRPQKAQFLPCSLWADLTPREWLRRKMVAFEHMQTGTWLVSRELAAAAGPWNTDLTFDDDGEYFCRVLLASNGTHFVPESKVYYRLSGAAQLSRLGRSAKKLESLWTSMQLHVRYARSLDGGDTMREACVAYLNNWSVYFYQGRPDLLEGVAQLVRDLGGRLAPPVFSWKYAWIGKLAGPGAATRVQAEYNFAKTRVRSTLDRLLAGGTEGKLA